MVGIKTFTYQNGIDLDCSCGCKGWWDDCVKNKANREKFVLSPPPSPHRTNDDWFTMDDNPIYTGPSNISFAPNIPSIEHRVSAKYISKCVDRYFSTEN
tara:strand:- start:203 stop:499 length:297 start_codon:yes stop_codon:yes gene_type:complete